MIFIVKSKKDSFIEKCYNKAIKELNEFFEIKWERNKPNIFIIEDRKTINEIIGRKSEDWVVGWNENKDIYILNRKNYEKESSHKYSDEDYSKLIKHELVHSFFQTISNNNLTPHWLIEGTAIFLSKQNGGKKNNPIKYKEFLDHFENNGEKVYEESGFAVQFLYEKYGKEKLLKLISSLNKINSEHEFKVKFKEIYGFELEYNNFN